MAKIKPTNQMIENWYKSPTVARMLTEHYEKLIQGEIEETKRVAQAIAGQNEQRSIEEEIELTKQLAKKRHDL